MRSGDVLFLAAPTRFRRFGSGFHLHTAKTAFTAALKREAQVLGCHPSLHRSRGARWLVSRARYSVSIMSLILLKAAS